VAAHEHFEEKHFSLEDTLDNVLVGPMVNGQGGGNRVGCHHHVSEAPAQWTGELRFGYNDLFCNRVVGCRSIEQRKWTSEGGEMANDHRLNVAWWTLRIGLGVGPFLAGLDKFFNLLTNWDMYLNPVIPQMLHVAPATFMHIVGVVEMVAGLLVFTRWTRYAAYIVAAWLVAISASLVSQGLFLDIAVRDLELALGAFVLAKLTEIREAVDLPATSRAVEVPGEAVHLS